jgi:putative SOS response-associated peptidase YedK
MKGIHDRMPVILTARDVTNWLFEPDRTRELLHKVPPKLTAKREYEQISLFQTMLLEKQ